MRGTPSCAPNTPVRPKSASRTNSSRSLVENGCTRMPLSPAEATVPTGRPGGKT